MLFELVNGEFIFQISSSSSEVSASSGEDTQCEVEKILGKRFEEGRTEYKISYKGYSR